MTDYIDLSWLNLPKKTPERYLVALREMTSGYELDPAEILSVTFPEEGAEMVQAEGIHFASLCEHHLLPFTGEARIEYRPRGVVVGLSKLARLVDCFSRRLQLQERLTGQIADAMWRYLTPHWVCVQVTASHGCICCRGVRQTGIRVTTTTTRGSGTKGVICGLDTD